jgi:cytidylate kinase
MIIITLDGVAASGKSTLARMLARELHYYYVCSGLLYRTVAYLLIHKFGYTESTVTHVDTKDIAACFDPSIFEYVYDEKDGEHVLFKGCDITAALKDSFVDKIASITSVNVYVRHFITEIQHALAEKYNIVTDGRDVGSVVFPHAQVKFYITAAIEVRAKRWLLDQKKHGHEYTLQQAVKKIADRDQRDRERSIGPLIIPNGAIVIDNSTMSLQETFAVMVNEVKKRSDI